MDNPRFSPINAAKLFLASTNNSYGGEDNLTNKKAGRISGCVCEDREICSLTFSRRRNIEPLDQ
jgi:hypothetical protein